MKRIFKYTVLTMLLVLSVVFTEKTYAQRKEDSVSTKDYILGREKTEEEIAEENALVPELNSYIPVEHDTPVSEKKYNLLKGTLPTKYDAREQGKVTVAKKQSPWDTCWAFAAISAAESSVISNGLEINGARTDNNLDLSEYQLAYFFYHSVTDPVGGTAGDATVAVGNHYLQMGGNSAYTTMALINWVGVTEEVKAPYENASESSSLPNALAYDDVAHLQNFYFISMKDSEMVKEKIMEYGAVTVGYYHDDRFYNNDTAAYFNKYETNSNHEVCIVGWDDNYAKENFTESPSADGAWLVKNSWGSEWGMDGCFWLSYEEASLINHRRTATAFAFDYEEADNYDHNYQYDGSYNCVSYGIRNGGAIANIFDVSACSAGYDERLEAVGVGIDDVGVTYSIQIYKNPSYSNNPLSGTPMLAVPQTGTINCAGYYTIPLTEPVQLAQGDTFAIVITLTDTNDGVIYYFVDENDIKDEEIHFINRTNPGESLYLYQASSSFWRDHFYENATARIKAYTSDTTYYSPGSLTLNKSKLTMTVGDNAVLKATVLPVNATNKAVLWKSSNSGIVSVSETGRMDALAAGKAVITACSAVDGTIYANCTVTVKPEKVVNITLSNKAGRKVKIKWKKQQRITGYEIRWSNKKTKGYNNYVRIKKAGTSTYTKKKLKKGRTYYFKIRSYKTVNGNRIYGEYSSPKRIKVKK